MEYPNDMDAQCVSLCDALNRLKGVKTEGSCCGHLKDRFGIWFRCNDTSSLSIIARAADRRYSGTKQVWYLECQTADITEGGFPTISFFLHSEKEYCSDADVESDTAKLAENILHWSDPQYAEHLGGWERPKDLPYPKSRDDFYAKEINMDRVEANLKSVCSNCTLMELLKIVREVSYDQVAYYGEDSKGHVFNSKFSERGVEQSTCLQRKLSEACDYFGQSIVDRREFEQDYFEERVCPDPHLVACLKDKISALEQELRNSAEAD